MDAPPEREDCQAFIKIAELFNKMNLTVPIIIDIDLSQGFLLMSDLGEKQYLDILTSRTSKADCLYNDALHALIRLQEQGKLFSKLFQSYDKEIIESEMMLFIEWFYHKELNLKFNKSQIEQWQRCIHTLYLNARNQPQVLVHRDYHSRNLMYLSENNPGILDFQDAVIGPITYDLVSLLRDCYISLPEEKVYKFALKFYENIDSCLKTRMNRKEFLKFFDLMGIQRHLKAIGIFARLKHRDGKDNYLKDIPRTLKYIFNASAKYSELDFLKVLVERQCSTYK